MDMRMFVAVVDVETAGGTLASAMVLTRLMGDFRVGSWMVALSKLSALCLAVYWPDPSFFDVSQSRRSPRQHLRHSRDYSKSLASSAYCCPSLVVETRAPQRLQPTHYSVAADELYDPQSPLSPSSSAVWGSSSASSSRPGFQASAPAYQYCSSPAAGTGPRSSSS